MKRDNSIIVGLVLGTIAALLLTARISAQENSSKLREEFHQVYPLSAGGSIELRNINGSVKVSTWEQNQVKVDAVKTARSKQRLDEAKIEVDARPDSISIRTRYPERDRDFRDDPDDNPANVEYALTVPASARLDEIKLVNGNLDLQNVSGIVRASCVNGRLTATGLRADTHLSTVNGRIEATVDRLAAQHRLELSSVNGPVTATLPSDANAELTAKTVSGAISNDFGLPVDDGRWVGHRLSGRLGQGEARVELRNVNGSITVHRASDGKPLSPATNLLSPRKAEMY